jgi:hypothetical protein
LGLEIGAAFEAVAEEDDAGCGEGGRGGRGWILRGIGVERRDEGREGRDEYG